MLNGRVTGDFEVNEWIEDDRMGDSNSRFVEDKGDDTVDMKRLQTMIVQGLNLTRIPDVSKVSRKIFFLILDTKSQF